MSLISLAAEPAAGMAKRSSRAQSHRRPFRGGSYKGYHKGSYKGHNHVSFKGFYEGSKKGSFSGLIEGIPVGVDFSRV